MKYCVVNKKTGKEETNIVVSSKGDLFVLGQDFVYGKIPNPDLFEIQEKKPLPMKKQFVEILNKMETVDRKMNKINDVLEETCDDSILFFPTIHDAVLNYLTDVFDDEEDSWIWYFVCDLDYGKEWEKGKVVDFDGTDIPMRTAEELYDFLISK